MKKRLIPSLFFVFTLCWKSSPAQIYVNHTAAGASDGTSWADAFTDLQDALAVADEGNEIWVAEGTYKPGRAPIATFLIDKDLKLYGGFAGTETTLAERGNPADYPTILSGDVNEDDQPGDFTIFRSDNVETVVTVTAEVTNDALIDGFTIQNGHADGTGDNYCPSKTGGGLHALGFPLLQNCLFQQNYADFRGGGAFFNYEGDQLLEISECTFIGNYTPGRGGGANILNSNCKVTDCSFLSNIGNQMGGGLRYINESGFQSVEITGCHFEDNQSNYGGGLRLQQSNLINPDAEGNISFLISDCTFTNNAAVLLQPGWGHIGGGVNCTFYPNTNSNTFQISGCSFSNNTSMGESAALDLANFGQNSIFEIDDCIFVQNQGELEGTLGIYSDSGGNGEFTVTNCQFEGNVARSGGAIDVWTAANSSAKVEVVNCLMEGNTGTEKGGGLNFLCLSDEDEYIIRNCRVLGNESPEAGAIAVLNVPQDTMGLKLGNESPEAGAIAVRSPQGGEASLFIENSLIAENTSDMAAILAQSIPILQLLNCTVANNQSNGIQVENQSGLILQNTILANPGYTEFEALTNDVTVTSNGGNLIGDGSFDGHDVPTDLPHTNPQFNGSDDPCDYYQLNRTSPAINAGTEPDTPSEFDLCGYDRVQNGQIDIGALESLHPTALKEAVAGEIHLSPNPATDFINFQLPETITQSNVISLFDAQGRLVERQAFTPGQAVQVGHLTSGFYTLKMADGEQVYIGRFVKG